MVAAGGLAVTLAVLLTAAGLTIDQAEEIMHPPRQELGIIAPGWEHEDLLLTTPDGLGLSAWYHPSRNGSAVVLAHGHGANRLQMLPEANLLVARGFGVLLFDWRAHGESGGELSTRGDRERLDLQSAVDWLAQRTDVRPGGIGVLGYSRGASVAIEAAARDPRIAAVVAEAATTSIEAGLNEDFGRFGAFSRTLANWWLRARGVDVESMSPLTHIAAIAPRPVFLVHGTLDRSTPFYMSTLLYAAAGRSKQLWLITGAGHGGYLSHVGPEYSGQVIEFFESALLRDLGNAAGERLEKPL